MNNKIKAIELDSGEGKKHEKYYKNIKYLLFFILLTSLGCDDKEIKIKDHFDYIIESTIAESGYVLEPAKLSIKIVPEEVVKGITYDLSYEVIDGASSI